MTDIQSSWDIPLRNRVHLRRTDFWTLPLDATIKAWCNMKTKCTFGSGFSVLSIESHVNCKQFSPLKPLYSVRLQAPHSFNCFKVARQPLKRLRRGEYYYKHSHLEVTRCSFPCNPPVDLYLWLYWYWVTLQCVIMFSICLLGRPRYRSLLQAWWSHCFSHHWSSFNCFYNLSFSKLFSRCFLFPHLACCELFLLLHFHPLIL